MITISGKKTTEWHRAADGVQFSEPNLSHVQHDANSAINHAKSNRLSI